VFVPMHVSSSTSRPPEESPEQSTKTPFIKEEEEIKNCDAERPEDLSQRHATLAVQ